MNRSRALALAVIATLGAAAVAQAQPAAAPPPPAHGHMASSGFDPSHMHQRMEAEHAERIRALHEALNIRPEQEAAFNAFAAAMHPNAHDDWRKHDETDVRSMDAMTTPQRMDHMAQMMDERTTHMREEFQRKITATKALYAVLSPDQRHTLDALHDLMGHHGGRGGGRPMGRGHDHQG